MGNLDFGLLDTSDPSIAGDYRDSSDTVYPQLEHVAFLSLQQADTYNTIRTVTTGKTYYITGIAVSSNVIVTLHIATGAGAAEVDFFAINLLAKEAFNWTFKTPVKIPSGTRISVKSSTDEMTNFTLIGYEE